MLVAGKPSPKGCYPELALDEIAKLFASKQHQEIISLLEKRCGRTIPFMRDATAGELEPSRLNVLRRSEGDIAELRKWIEFANIEVGMYSFRPNQSLEPTAGRRDVRF
jgi:hypothetical protein